MGVPAAMPSELCGMPTPGSATASALALDGFSRLPPITVTLLLASGAGDAELAVVPEVDERACALPCRDAPLPAVAPARGVRLPFCGAACGPPVPLTPAGVACCVCGVACAPVFCALTQSGQPTASSRVKKGTLMPFRPVRMRRAGAQVAGVLDDSRTGERI